MIRRKEERTATGYDGRIYRVGDRVELQPDLVESWGRGKFRKAVVVGIGLTEADKVRVRFEGGGDTVYAGYESAFRKERIPRPLGVHENGIAESDLAVTRLANGGWEVAAIIDGQRVRERYFDYTRREAIELFLDEHLTPKEIRDRIRIVRPGL